MHLLLVLLIQLIRKSIRSFHLKITKQFTNRESQSLDKYLQEIGKVDLLTADEEIELAKKIKKGDQKA
ncbi:MAG TPA: hypothetical protein ENN33_01270, partial [Ignavibacteria bacterium]|nr:hypothetical protein [Ignavibacteria bacterium]